MTTPLPGSRWRTAVLAAVATICLGAVVYASAHPSAWHLSLPNWVITPAAMPSFDAPSMPGLGQDQLPNSALSPVWRYIFIGLGIAAATAIVVIAVLYVIRAVRTLIATRIDAVPQRDQLAVGAALVGAPLTAIQVQDAVAQALERLNTARTPSDAIILAWLALEDAAERHGVARNPAQTPTEFTSDLLAASSVPIEDTVALRTVYLRTRFSARKATAADVQNARGWLEHIARSLEVDRV